MSRTEENRKYIDKKKALGFSRYYFMLKGKEAQLIRQAIRNLDIRDKVFQVMEKNITALSKPKSTAELMSMLHAPNSTAQYEGHNPSNPQSEVGGSYVQ